MSRAMYIAAVLCVLGCGAWADEAALSPSDSLKALVMAEGFEAELVAWEPLVVDPVAVAFDELGRMYVAENRGYPTGPAGGGAGGVGVVALLEDTDGDGVYDKRSELAAGLSFPNGLMCWRGGVFVTCAPDILYLKDSDGDGKADVRRVVATGFSTAQSTQLRVSHPVLGPDNWVYVTSGLVGGKVVLSSAGEAKEIEANSDFRFRPDGSAIEAVGGRSQFGMSFDDFGRRFVCSNRNPAQHALLMPRHLKRNPYLPISGGVHDVADAHERAKVFPLTRDTTTASFIPSLLNAPHAGTFTSACGLLVYRGAALGGGCEGNLFICEPAQGLVQRQVVEAQGPTFTARRVYEGSEFMASRDAWFRPVFAADGPDGALYICDMYRKVIDHPDYLPKETHARMDFDAGKDRGRIYRVVRKGRDVSRPARLAGLDVVALCRELQAGDGWTRDTARRLLLERADPQAVAPLVAMVTGDKEPRARSAAMWTLEGLGALSDETIGAALADAEADVREQAARVIEERAALEPESARRWLKELEALSRDAGPRVRFQAALALSGVHDAAAIAPLVAIAARDAADPWTRFVTFSAATLDLQRFGDALTGYDMDTESGGAIYHDLGRVFGVKATPKEVVDFVLRTTGTTKEASWADAALLGLTEGLRSRGYGAGQPVLAALLGDTAAHAAELGKRWEVLDERWTRVALGGEHGVSERVTAATLLGELGHAEAQRTLKALLSPDQPVQVQQAALAPLARWGGAEAGQFLVSRQRWGGYSPAMRESVIASLMSNPPQLPALLDAMEQGWLPVWVLDPSRRERLVKHTDESLRNRAAALFKNNRVTDRWEAYEQSKAVLSLAGDGPRGREVFVRACAACHTHGSLGVRVGPDLSGVYNQPAEALLLHIVVPEHEIYPEFTQYLLSTKDGRSLVGIIASESASTVTLRIAGGQEETLQREHLASITSLELSLMPQELEKTMTGQELADLLTFLKGQTDVQTKQGSH